MAQFTASDAINAGTGVYSLVRGLTRRRPGSFQPAQYQPVVAPAVGDPEALMRQRNEISNQTALATRDVQRIAGSDSQAGIAARLGIQRNANQASAEAEAANTRMVREQQREQNQVQNQAAYTNAMLQNQANQVNYEQDMATYNQQGAAAGQGVASSLSYIAQREANLANNAQTVANQEAVARQQLDAVAGSLYQDAYVRAIVASKSEEEARKIAAESVKGFTSGSGFVPRTRKLS